MRVIDYASAEAFLVSPRTKKPVPRRKIANNTYVERGGHVTERGDQIHSDEIAVVLHNTAIVVYGRDYIRLNTGGWLTMVTCARIEEFTPPYIRIFTDSGTSRWRVSCGLQPTTGDPKSAPMYDGITLVARQAHGDFTACAGNDCAWAGMSTHQTQNVYLLRYEDQQRDIDAEDAHNAMVKRLLTGYLAKVRDGSISLTFAACALCRFDASGLPTDQKVRGYGNRVMLASIGDLMDDQQHLIDHMIDGELPRELEEHALVEQAGSIERAERWLEINHRRAESIRKFILARLLMGAVTIHHGRRPIPAMPTPTPVAVAAIPDPF